MGEIRGSKTKGGSAGSIHGSMPLTTPTDMGNLDRLAQLGIAVDPATGKAVALPEGPFQGSTSPDADPDDLGPGVQVTVDRPEIFRPDDKFVDEESALPDESSAAPEPHRREPGSQTEEGLAKREKDAREAQAAMSKAQAKLDKTLLEVNQKMVDLNQKIDQLAALQVTTGGIPADLNPADEATIAEYRENDPESISVMEAIVAPVYTKFANLEDRLNGLINQVGEFLAKAREEKVLGPVYARIPKEKMDLITNSPEFIGWLSETPEPFKSAYIETFNSTARYSSEAAFRALRDFQRDAGIDLGLDDNAHPGKASAHNSPEMPTTPALRSGGALPPPAPPRRQAVSATTPLSPDELANWRTLMDNAKTQSERDLLQARLRATPLDFSGAQLGSGFANPNFRS